MLSNYATIILLITDTNHLILIGLKLVGTYLAYTQPPILTQRVSEFRGYIRAR